MKPLDMASAEFDLAKAYLAAGDKAKAEDSVLASLEAAPGFKEAQKLLLEIEGKIRQVRGTRIRGPRKND